MENWKSWVKLSLRNICKQNTEILTKLTKTHLENNWFLTPWKLKKNKNSKKVGEIKKAPEDIEIVETLKKNGKITKYEPFKEVRKTCGIIEKIKISESKLISF